jgi:hypothetical protein
MVRQHFFPLLLLLDSGSEIQDLGSGLEKKIGIRDKHPGCATLIKCMRIQKTGAVNYLVVRQL